MPIEQLIKKMALKGCVVMLFNKNGKQDNYTEDLTPDSLSLITECMLKDELSKEELEAFLEDSSEINSAMKDEVLLEKTIVRMDKYAKLNRGQKIAVFTIAREKKDPKFKKLLTIWRIERFLEAELMKKYGNEGMRRAKAAMNKSRTSTSKIVKTVANKVHNQFNTGIK